VNGAARGKLYSVGGDIIITGKAYDYVSAVGAISGCLEYYPAPRQFLGETSPLKKAGQSRDR